MQNTWIVVLNWRNGQDTIECLRSIVESRSQLVSGVIICDNASGDESVAKIRDWSTATNIRLPEYAWSHGQFVTQHSPGDDRINAAPFEFILIHTGENLGFAGGNNVGLEFLRRHRSFDFAFLLNNDALLTAGAIEEMVGRFSSPDVGMCGCTVVYHHAPETVQAYAGSRFRPVFGRARHIGAGASVDAPRYQAQTEAELDYIIGAALMISRNCLDRIGLMEERYFLYYEEIDWATRAKRAGYRLAYAPHAVIFHKEGKTIGSSSQKAKRSLLSEHYLVRSRLIFTSKFYPFFLPTVVLYTAIQMFRHIIRRDTERFNTCVRALLGLPFSTTARDKK
jgi:GT2 family glycosyltransferase